MAIFSICIFVDRKRRAMLQVLYLLNLNQKEREMKKLVLAIGLALFSFAAFAEDGQELTTIIGTNIDMKLYDHAMAGSIKDFVAWGFFDEANGNAEMIMRKYEQTIKTVFKKQENGKFGGTVSHTKDNVRYDTVVEFVKVDAAKKEIHLKIDNEDVVITTEPESVNAGHMVNPKFTTTLKGETVSYVLGGESCFGKSTFFAMMILGAYSH